MDEEIHTQVERWLYKKGPRGWTIASPDPVNPWCRLSHVDCTARSQGWKLHVAAETNTVDEVLERALDVLYEEKVNFKLTGTLEFLSSLNSGRYGLSQIAKFITVFPGNDEQAIAVARHLDAVLMDFRGPEIYSDVAIRRGSIISYRYGAFGQQTVQLASGERVPAIYDREHNLVPDHRSIAWTPPDWIEDPFSMAGLSYRPSPRIGAYYVVSTIHVSLRGRIALGVDLQRLRKCIIKTGRKGQGLDARGLDAAERLEHEASVLRAMATGPFAEVYDLVHDAGDVHLVLEYIEGQSLDIALMSEVASRTLRTNDCIRIAKKIGNAVAMLHREGIVFGDLKPSNVILKPDGDITLIDFESCTSVSTAPGPRTRGFSKSRALRTSYADDIRALGGILYWMTTGADPSRAPDRDRPFARAVAAMNPVLSPDVCQFIEDCVAIEDGQSTAPEITPYLGQLDAVDSTDTSADLGSSAVLEFDALAREIGDHLIRDAIVVGGEGVIWRSNELVSPRTNYDLSTGSSGIVLVLAELVRRYRVSDHEELLRAAVLELRRSCDIEMSSHGLYVGRSGHALALLVAGTALNDEATIAAALRQADEVAMLAVTGHDVFAGAAGRLQFHVWMWLATGGHGQLEAARRIATHLLQRARNLGDGPSWSDSANPYLGYAHGTAGVLDALLSYVLVSDDQAAKEVIRHGCANLVSHAVPTLSDGSGVDWPAVAGGPLAFARWCHGATGIGSTFLNAARTESFPEAREVAAAAARHAALATRGLGCCRCHGVSGTIELMIDMFKFFNDQLYVTWAKNLAQLLIAFRVERAGKPVWMCDEPDDSLPALMTGYSGIGLALMRLAEPRSLKVFDNEFFASTIFEGVR